MKYLPGLGLLLLGSSIHAQKTFDGLINAEKSFAAYSVAHGTKPAFLKFLDSAGIVFDQGKPLNGIESWNRKENRPGVLNWSPQYAEISISNNFGYTTGPWTFQAAANDTVLARGQYITIWHADKNGHWKFLADLGVSRTPSNDSDRLKKIQVSKTKGKARKLVEVIRAEDHFLELLKADKQKAYHQCLSAKSILNRHGQSPAVTASDQQQTIEATPSLIEYKRDGWQESDKIDMGFVYGTMAVNGKTENYLRIWRHEKEGWKIAVEVLRY